MVIMDNSPQDLFISYASEDRKTAAAPLAALLTALGLTVWYDQTDLNMGDSLRQRIDEGLGTCRYGVVLLSESFFRKHHTNRELDGLAQREVNGQKVILPVWLDVDETHVRQFSPPLADRIAARWAEGVHVVATKIIQVVKPGLIEQIQAEYVKTQLPRLHTGREVMSVIGSAHFGFFHHDDPAEVDELDLIGTFLQELRDWSDVWSDLEIGEHVRTEFELTARLQQIEAAGWFLFGKRVKQKRKIAGTLDDWIVSVVALLRGKPEEVRYDGNQVLVLRRDAASNELDQA